MSDSTVAIAKIQKNQPLVMSVLINGIKKDINIVPENGKVGIYISYKSLDITKNLSIQKTGLDGIVAGARETYYSSRLTLSFLGDMIHGLFVPKNPREHEDAKSMLSGPIGIGATFVGLVQIGVSLSTILIIIALLSINLGVVNLLPFPALDGGRLVTTTLYSLIVQINKKSEATFLKYEKYFHTLGFILLMILTLYVAGLDISRFF
jgi:regulator of sigma E protease